MTLRSQWPSTEAIWLRPKSRDSEIRDVRLRAVLRCNDRKAAEALLWEVEALLCCGPAGGGGYRGQIDPSVLTYSTFLDRKHVSSETEILTV